MFTPTVKRAIIGVRVQRTPISIPHLKMSLVTYTKLVNKLIVATRTSQFEDIEFLKTEIDTLANRFSPEEAYKADLITKSLAMYHSQP